MYIYQSHNSVPQIVIKSTAGGKEAKKLEKVKKTFEKAYRESTDIKNAADEGGVSSNFIGYMLTGSKFMKQAKI